MFKPTIGFPLWYRPGPNERILHGGSNEPHAAIITYVNGDGVHLNLVVFDHGGNTTPRLSVVLRQDGEPAPAGAYCERKPTQIVVPEGTPIRYATDKAHFEAQRKKAAEDFADAASWSSPAADPDLIAVERRFVDAAIMFLKYPPIAAAAQSGTTRDCVIAEFRAAMSKTWAPPPTIIDKSEQPKVNDLVRYCPRSDMSFPLDGSSFTATITCVHDRSCVDLIVIDQHSRTHARNRVALRRPGEKTPKYSYCEWSPRAKPVDSASWTGRASTTYPIAGIQIDRDGFVSIVDKTDTSRKIHLGTVGVIKSIIDQWRMSK